MKLRKGEWFCHIRWGQVIFCLLLCDLLMSLIRNAFKRLHYTVDIVELSIGKSADGTIKIRQNKYSNNLIEQDHRSGLLGSRPPKVL
ncbi:hypothetical protein XBKQ1_2800008 [Xenorhabdus bovienii str. kraussei Quebec]|uniref:Uncharacterized protein n=1 Tax=Xenorhabdus bovienii str. kraussei Quebec TaxID=1398203 RepID=A0A077PJF1_XENBV|nr:hypothetical protein XBKQ1_2800008 [Xenorhabdus bovienii str. kraussei Quebec]